jgi:Zn-dependent M28 family amino/carboxypeptidase
VSADFVPPGEPVTLPAPLSTMMAGLSARAIGTHIAALASPGFDGRGLGQRGLEATAEYIAAMLAVRGVPPLATPAIGSLATAAYFQPVPMREITSAQGQLTIEVRRGHALDTRTFLSGVDCLFQERPPQDLSGSVVFAGYGIRETTPLRDDYQDLDVKDRVVVVLGATPSGPDWDTDSLRAKYASDGRIRHEAKAALAASLGARAVIAIEGEAFPTMLASGRSAPAARYFVPYETGAVHDGTIPVIRVSAAVGNMLLASAGTSTGAAAHARPQALAGVSVMARTTGTERLVIARNVVAAIPGSDAALRREAVVIGAHMDHLGRTGDTVYPGADDNASGTAALLEIAAAMASAPQRPRRTVVFAFWTGEEEGHLGSEYYAQHPLWPMEQTTVYLNLDMIGHPWTTEEIRSLVTGSGLENGAAFLATVKTDDFIELGVPPTARDLDPVLTQVARAAGLALHLDRTDGLHGGSDYRAFARKGRPFVRFFGNYFPGYHEPTDTPDQVDPAQVLKMARVALGAGWMMADR